MSSPHVVSIAQLAILALFSAVVFLIAREIKNESARQAFKRLHGAHDAPWLPTQSVLQRWLGLDLFLSNAHGFATHTFLQASAERIRASGLSTYRQTIAGQTTYLTIEPENLKTILAANFKTWRVSDRRTTRSDTNLIGKGIFTTNGEEWNHSRQLLRPNFARAQVFDLARTFRPHVSSLIGALPRDGRTVNLSTFFFRLTMDTATELLFGESTNCLEKGSDAGFSEAAAIASDEVMRARLIGGLRNMFPSSKRVKAAIKFVHDFADSYVRRGLERKHDPDSVGGDRYVFLNEIVRDTDDRMRIRSELLNVFIAGRDTTATLMVNLWFVLSTRPDLWERLQQEVAKLNGADPTIDQVKEMKYMSALMNESLRMHPVVAFDTRQACEDTVLPVGGGPDLKQPVYVKKGTQICWSLYSLHRRKDIYGDDADEFKPERWLQQKHGENLRPSWAYLPFNGGPRTCLGQQFALTETAYTTIRLCQVFDRIECRAEMPVWQENFTPVCANRGGAKVALFARAS